MNSTSQGGHVELPFTGDAFTSALPIPVNELNARGGAVTVTCG